MSIAPTISRSGPLPTPERTAIRPSARRGRPPSTAILDRLTEAGLKLLENEDPSTLTIERICQTANVSRATFYRRWKSINPIVAAMAAKLLHLGSSPIHGTNLREELKRSMWARAVLLADERVGTLFRWLAYRASQDLDLRMLIQDLDTERNAPVLEILGAAQHRGEIHDRFPLQFVLHQLFGPVWHRALVLQLPADATFIDATVDMVCDALTIW